MFLSRGHVWRAEFQGRPANVVLWHLFKKSFKSSHQRGVNVTLESLVSHRDYKTVQLMGYKPGTNSVIEILLQLCIQMRVGRIFQRVVYMQPTRR